MSHFAKIDRNNIVTQVIVAEQDFINSGLVGESFEWVQTSYNTRNGLHYDNQTGLDDAGFALRYNFAAVGFTYDAIRDAFIAPQPYPSWILNEDTCNWQPPTARPDYSNEYTWDEATTNWIEITE
jgi:hypothetical protein